MPGTDDIYTIGVEAELTKVTGMATVTKSIQKAYDKARIDPRSLKAFEDAMMKSSKTFYDTVGNARAAGLLKDADALERKMMSVQDSIVRGTEQAASIQSRLQGDLAEGEKRALAEKLRSIKEGIKLQEQALEKEANQIQKRAERRSEGIGQLDSFIGMSPDEKAQAGLGIAEGFLDNLDRVNPSDMAGMAKGLLQGMGKGGGMLEALGGKIAAGASTTGGAAAGGGLASIGAAAASLAAVAGVLAGVVALLVKADKQTKDWNKTLLDGAGAADLAFEANQDGFKEMRGSLEAARKASIKMSYQFREQPDEILSIIAKANEMGLTFGEIEERLGQAGDKMSAYAELTKVALVYSRTLGVSQGEIAEQTATWMHDLGGGLRTVEEGFSAIFQSAMVSGIGVKRFFGFVTQATAGLALYNVRIEEAAALIAELGESLGEAEAANFVQGLTKGFAADSYVDRFKRIMLTGQGATKRVIEANADVLTETFTKRMGELGPVQQGAIKKAFRDANIDYSALKQGGAAAAAELKKMGELPGKEARALVTQIRGADPATARQLETLIGATEGLSGNMGDQAKAMDELGPGGVLAMQLNQAMGFFGKPLSDLGAMQLAAFEQFSGISGEELHQLQRVETQIRGNYEAAEEQLRLAREGQAMTMSPQEMAKQFGLVVEGQGETARLVTGALDEQYGLMKGSEVENIEEYLVRQGDALANAVMTPMTAQEAMAKELVKNTTSITALLETVVAHGFERLANLLQALYDASQHLPSSIRKEREEMVENLQRIREELAQVQEKAYQDLSKAEQRAATAKTPEEREKAQAEVAALQKDIEAREAQLQEVEGDAYKIEQATGGQLMGMAAAGLFRQKDTAEGRQALYSRVGIDFSKYEGGGAGLMGETPTDRKRREEETLTNALASEVSEPLSEYSGKMTDEMEKEHKDLLRKYPDLTEEGYLKALKRKEMGDIAAMLWMSAENQQEVVDRLAEGERLTELEMGMLQAGGLEGGDLARIGAIYGPANWNPPTAVATPEVETPAQDFIYRGDAGGGTITPFNSADDLLGMKAGGAIDKALGAGGMSSVTININGGDTAQIYSVVKKAMRESGVRPAPGGRTVP